MRAITIEIRYENDHTGRDRKKELENCFNFRFNWQSIGKKKELLSYMTMMMIVVCTHIQSLTSNKKYIANIHILSL